MQKNPRGRPPIGPGVGFCCPKDVLDEIENAALRMGVKRADLLRRACIMGWESMQENIRKEVMASGQ